MAKIKSEFLLERQGKQFALFAGLLDAAHAEGLKSIDTALLQIGSDENNQTWIFRAVVETEKGKFSGHGDASPANVSRQMLTVLPRMAETRAIARALRFAVNASVVAAEELSDDDDSHPAPAPRPTPAAPAPVQQRPVTGEPMTEAQRNAIFSVGKALGMTEQALEDQYGIGLGNLNKVTASQVIGQLQERKKAGR